MYILKVWSAVSGADEALNANAGLYRRLLSTTPDSELVETIKHMNLPEEMTGTYESKPMNNTMHNTFTMVTDTVTRWDAEIHYTEMNGFVVKLMAKLFPNMFKKQAQKWFDQFKEFAENQNS